MLVWREVFAVLNEGFQKKYNILPNFEQTWDISVEYNIWMIFNKITELPKTYFLEPFLKKCDILGTKNEEKIENLWFSIFFQKHCMKKNWYPSFEK